MDKMEEIKSDNKYKEEKRKRALLTLKKRVESGEVDRRVAQVVLERYLEEPEMTEDTYLADKMREAQAIFDKLKKKKE